MSGSDPTGAALSALPPLRDVIRAAGLAADKRLGQHFLLDLNVTRKIVDKAAPLAGVHAIEIGPGPGGLTRALCESDAASVLAVEKDPRCTAALAPLVAAAAGRLRLMDADALTVDLLAETPAPRAIIANLPYNVGTPMLLGWLRQMPSFQSLTLMFQAEVVDRITAAPCSKAYGRLSVITQFVGDARRVMTLPAAAFTPPPKVASAVVHITPRAARPPDIPFTAIERLTAAAFGQRRKMLRASLRPLGGEALLRAAGIDPSRRAEDLGIADFENLARHL